MYNKIEWKGNGGRTKDRYRNNTPVYPSSIPDLTLPGRYFGLVVHCRAPLSSASGLGINAFLHLWSFTVPTSPCSGQGSSSSNTMLLILSPTFNFYINVGIVWCWWATHGTSISMRFGPLMYDFDIRRCYDFYPTSHFSPFLSLPPLVAGRSLYTVISSYLSITTYCLLRRSNAVCLLMHSTLTYAQPSCTVYKDIMDTHFQ